MSDFLPSNFDNNASIDVSTDEKKIEAKKGVLIAIKSVFNVLMKKIDQGEEIKFSSFKSIVKESLEEIENVKALETNLEQKISINENSNTTGGT